MRAAWWWIDRWRKSTAYIVMSLEQQGIYRNLLDALWLFEDHIIPDNPKVLVAASGGDIEAWTRSGPEVLKWMQRKGGGWTNATALEVIEKSEARARAGAQGAAQRLANAQAKAQANGKQNASYPSPSPSPSNERRAINQSAGEGGLGEGEEKGPERLEGPPRHAAAENAPEVALSVLDPPESHPEPEEYGRLVWSAFVRLRGSETPRARATEYALIRRWYDQGIPVRVVLQALSDSRQRLAQARSLLYAGPIVEQELSRWQRATT
jgi:uncharacterized protein YdaU (DUF1376 family)